MIATVISVFTSVLSGILLFVIQRLVTENRKIKEDHRKKEAEHSRSIADGLVCLLRVQLIVYHEKYTSEGSISIHARENWSTMYKAYTGLGGNGMIEGMDREISDLPIKMRKGVGEYEY